LLTANDLSIWPDRLSFIRTYPSRYSLRTNENSKSAFCHGWQDNLHMSFQIDKTFNVAILTISGVEHILYESDEQQGVYNSAEYQIDVNTNNVAVIVSKAYEITYYFGLSEKCLRKIEMSSNLERAETNNRVTLNIKCNPLNSKITEIESADNSMSIRFAYSQSNCLTAISKYVRDEGGNVETILYTYDNQKRLLSAVGPRFSQSMSYYQSSSSSNNLREMIEENKFSYSFEYENENGLLLSKIRRFDFVSSQNVIDLGYSFEDNGIMRIEDRIQKVVTKRFFDLNGRLVYEDQNGLRSIKIKSNVESPESSILQNGQVF
jgi:hypothetical protein